MGTSDISELKRPKKNKALDFIVNVLFFLYIIYVLYCLFYQSNPLIFLAGPAAYSIR